MKINKTKKINKFVLVAIAVVVLAVGYLVSAYFVKWYPFQNVGSVGHSDRKVNEVSYDQPTDEQQKAGDEAQKQSENAPSAYKPIPSTSPTQLAITSANQQNGVLEIRTTVSTIDESGKCSLSFSKAGSSTIAQEVGIQSMGSYSVCKGFDLQTSGLVKGDWTAVITYSGASPSATVIQGIKVQ